VAGRPRTTPHVCEAKKGISESDGCCGYGQRLFEMGPRLRRRLHKHGGDHVGGVRWPCLLPRRRVRQHLREQQRAGGDQLRAAREQGRHEGSRGARFQPPAKAGAEQGGAEEDGDHRHPSVGSCSALPPSFYTPYVNPIS
jgi:hypothetical protein